MSISETYSEVLKKRAIERFIKENRRSPTKAELQELVFVEQRRYPNVDRTGVSGYDVIKPGFESFSSATDENVNRKALYDDMMAISKRLDRLIQSLEDSYRGFNGTVRRTKHALNQVESRLDNLLLLNSNVDAFVYGFEETFDLQDKIDFTNTDASVEAGYVTMGRSGYKAVDLTDAKITYSTVSERSIVGSSNTSKIEYLKEEDGTIWEHLVYTKTRQGRVSLLVDIDLQTPTYVNDLRFTGVPIGVNQYTTATVFYSLDGQTYTALEPAEVVVNETEYMFNLALDDVQKIRLMLSKEVADNVTTTANQYVYVFALDSLKIFADTYTSDTVSTLYAGPYELVNEFGEPVYFTKATLSACAVTDGNSSVDFFLSKDNSTWESVNYTKDGLDYVSFSNGSREGTYEVIDLELVETALVESAEDVEDLNLSTEALLNVFIPEQFAGSVPLQSIEIKRNIPNSDIDTLYQVSPGWFFDSETNQYTTTVYIGSPEGRVIDFGPTGVLVNGTLLVGEVFLQPGYTVISTSDSNWYPIPDNLSTLNSLKRADPLYPYNHKYLIEGYSYPLSFSSERVYNGVEEYFGRLLKYVPPEQFNSGVTEHDFDIFTVDNPSGDLFFKIKVDKTDASWKDEQFEVDWVVQNSSSNLLYVKAVLSASEDGKSPILEHFKIRVI